MTSGDYQQVLAYKAVIDWLNGRARAFTSRSRQHTITADWASGKVTTTGLSYLGTMSNALATTGVDGLEMVIAKQVFLLGTTIIVKMDSSSVLEDTLVKISTP